MLVSESFSEHVNPLVGCQMGTSLITYKQVMSLFSAESEQKEDLKPQTGTNIKIDNDIYISS